MTYTILNFKECKYDVRRAKFFFAVDLKLRGQKVTTKTEGKLRL